MILSDGYFSLGENVNKISGTETDEKEEGVVSSLLDELTLPILDKELISIKKEIEKNWEKAEKELSAKQEDNERYWLGKHFSDVEYAGGKRPLVDNLIFESLETLIPIITRANPEPVVMSDSTVEGESLSKKIQSVLFNLADVLTFKLKFKKLVRYWSLYYLGVMKIGWSAKNNQIDISVIRPQRLILDPNAYIRENGTYTGRYLGERRQDTASNLIRRFPKKTEYISTLANNKLSTIINYVELWTSEYVCWILNDEVLGKSKNPHYNYKNENNQNENINHFSAPEMPYLFLSVFNLGKKPYDETSLIGQNLAIQDLINKRLKQIDKNADSANGGAVVSGDHFTKEQAAEVSEELRRGGTIWVPNGDISRAYQKSQGTPLPQFVYQSLLDYRAELKNIIGVAGSTAGSLQKDETVRGKIISREIDSSRISGITAYLEEFSDSLYNWFVQMIYVYYDQEHFFSVIGKEKTLEYFSIKNADMDRKIFISVKPGSMIPKDPLLQRNEAVELYQMGALDPITLFEKLDFPDAMAAAKKLFLWKTAPHLLFPDLPQPILPPQGGEIGQPPAPENSNPKVPLSQIPVPEIPVSLPTI